MKNIISRADAEQYGREGVRGFNYKLPHIDGGSSVIHAELTVQHGQRTTLDRSRIYYILEGRGEFMINGERVGVGTGDVISIPPHTTYDYRPTTPVIKVLLFMELLDVSKLLKNRNCVK